MLWSTPPLRRPSRVLALAVFLMAGVLAMAPAGAQSEPSVAIPARVEGRNAMSITVTGVQAVAVTITDAAGAVATWTFDASSTAQQVFTIDLAAPGSGAEPVNGTAQVAIAAGGTPVHEAQVVLDRDPAAPALQIAAAGRRVDTWWAGVSGPGAVTYVLERSAPDSGWTTIVDGTDALAHTDRALSPGAYAYRLTAVVAAADGGMNRSTASEGSATVEEAGAPEEEAEGDQEQTGAGDDDAAGENGGRDEPKDRVLRRRRVAAAGGVTDAVAERSRKPRSAPVAAYARGPSLAGFDARTGIRFEAAPAPVTLAPRPVAPLPSGIPWRATTAAPPVPAAGGATLAVTTAGALDHRSLAIAFASGLLALLVFAHGAAWRRTIAQPGGGRSPVKK